MWAAHLEAAPSPLKVVPCESLNLEGPQHAPSSNPQSRTRQSAIKKSYLKNKTGTPGLAQGTHHHLTSLFNHLFRPKGQHPRGFLIIIITFIYLFIYIGAHAVHSTYVETREQRGESVLIFHFIIDPKHLTQVLSSRPA